MINQYEIHALLKKEIPQLTLKNYPSRASLEVYACINAFTDYTKHAVEEHNYNQARKCFGLAEKLYQNGDSMVRLLIENSFIYSLSKLMTKSTTERFMIDCILPDSLYKIYKKHGVK